MQAGGRGAGCSEEGGAVGWVQGVNAGVPAPVCATLPSLWLPPPARPPARPAGHPPTHLWAAAWQRRGQDCAVQALGGLLAHPGGVAAEGAGGKVVPEIGHHLQQEGGRVGRQLE